jgi:3-dehydroquinate synthase
MSEQTHIQNIHLRLEEDQSYDIYIGRGLFNQNLPDNEWLKTGNRAFLLVDERVSELYASEIEELRTGLNAESFIHLIPSGEQSKSMKEFQRALDFLLNNGVNRRSPLIAIGGGVTGDLAGFVAATAMRGIPLIHIPTTLLAMVDSSIGGKTGINHSSGKNLIGSFYQPKAVFCDINFLKTLDRRDWINGLSEVLKYGLIRDPQIVESCRELLNKGNFMESEKWDSLITKSVKIKADIVSQDAKESGLRELLNFGHTYGHAIENFTGYDAINHGEAVFAGMLAELQLGHLMGFEASPSMLKDFKSLYNLDLTALEGNIESLIELMKRDKKVKAGQIRLALVQRSGEAGVLEVNDHAMLAEAWSFMIKQFE